MADDLQSANSYISCNQMKNLGYGLRCAGQMPSDIFNNTFTNCNIGFWLSNQGYVGPQDNPTQPPFTQPSYNKWYGGSVFADAYTSDYTDGTQSPFYFRSIPTFYVPSPNLFEVITNSLPISTVTSNNCPVFSPACQIVFPKLIKEAHKIAKNQISFQINDNIAKWHNKLALYNNILIDSIDVSADTVLTDFVDSASISNLGIILQLNAALSNPDIFSDNYLLYSLFYLNNFTPTNNAEENAKTVNEIYISYLLNNGELETDKINSLISVAEKCPFTDGIAVYQARAILTNIDTTYYGFENPCEMDNSSNLKSAETDTINNFEVLIFPNPASTEIYIQLLEDTYPANIEIYDVIGNIILKEKLEKADNVLNVSCLKNGIYFYIIATQNKKIKGKLVIIANLQ